MPGYRVAKSQLKGSCEGLSKYTCPLCHLLLRDAVQPSCGHWLCESCAEKLFSTESHPHCPRDDCDEKLVQEDGQNFFPDRFVRREILAFPLYCSYHESGCTWEGILGDFESHLDECLYMTVTCECGEKVLLRQMDKHMKTACPKFRKVCPLADLGCPDKSTMTRDELVSHCGTPSTIVDHLEIMATAFQSLRKKWIANIPKRPPTEGGDSGMETSGSSVYSRAFDVEVDGRRKGEGDHGGNALDMISEDSWDDTQSRNLGAPKRALPSGSPKSMKQFHLVEGPTGESFRMKNSAFVDAQVMQYVAMTVQTEARKVREEVETKYMLEIEKRDAEIKALQQLTTQLQRTLQGKNAEIEDRDFRLSLIENSNYDGTMIWKIPQFSQRMTDAQTGKYTSIFSLPFYSGRYGYKMCLRLYIMGDGIGKNTHMSLFFVIMKGEFDNILPWPFSCRVTFRLINQKSGRDVVDTFQPDPMSSSFKKPKSDMNIASGCPRFIPHSDLKTGGYIVDDTVFIKCVVDRSSIRHP